MNTPDHLRDDIITLVQKWTEPLHTPALYERVYFGETLTAILDTTRPRTIEFWRKFIEMYEAVMVSIYVLVIDARDNSDALPASDSPCIVFAGNIKLEFDVLKRNIVACEIALMRETIVKQEKIIAGLIAKLAAVTKK
jgi:hypothetical protein